MTPDYSGCEGIQQSLPEEEGTQQHAGKVAEHIQIVIYADIITIHVS